MKKFIVNILKSNSLALKLLSFLYSFTDIIFFKGARNNSVKFSGVFFRKTKLRIYGKGNQITIEPENRLRNCLIHIHGSNNKMIINEHCILSNLELWIEDSNATIEIGERTTVEGGHIAATEGGKISVGSDCMFSHRIEIRNGDSHAIISLSNGERTNAAKDILIGNHVWLGADVKILKGVQIGNDCIIATGSIVTKSTDANCIYAGIPARKVNENITWIRERNTTAIGVG